VGYYGDHPRTDANVPSLASIFLDAIGSDGRTRLLPPDLDQRLALLAAMGAAAWPDLNLAPGDFAAHLAARIPAESSDLGAALDELHAADLYLACACARDVPGAIAAFEAAHGPMVASFIARIDRAPAFVSEVMQLVRQRVFVGSVDKPPRIQGYAGRGPLAGWVGIAAQRIALDLVDKEKVEARARERAMADEIGTELDPELQYIKVRYREAFERAFARAVEDLGARERALLRLQIAGGLTLEQIGTMYKVNASTVSRWIAGVRTALLAETERLLRAELSLSPPEFNSLARVLVSQLDISVSRLLVDREPE
jgi:RNA polymerase sigma-70 factor (ECF subfamily)